MGRGEGRCDPFPTPDPSPSQWGGEKGGVFENAPYHEWSVEGVASWGEGERAGMKVSDLSEAARAFAKQARGAAGKVRARGAGIERQRLRQFGRGVRRKGS
jgi:hypothetical protein